MITADPGLWIAVKTADCVPILIADGKGRAVAALHAGWRGLRAGIVRRAVEQLCSRFALEPAGLHAAIGPSIGPCCYEVGGEVAGQFDQAFVRPGPRPHLDLWSANRADLLDAGLTEPRVESANLCTRCREKEFHSWRRDGDRAGRMFSAIRLSPR